MNPAGIFTFLSVSSLIILTDTRSLLKSLSAIKTPTAPAFSAFFAFDKNEQSLKNQTKITNFLKCRNICMVYGYIKVYRRGRVGVRRNQDKGLMTRWSSLTVHILKRIGWCNEELCLTNLVERGWLDNTIKMWPINCHYITLFPPMQWLQKAVPCFLILDILKEALLVLNWSCYKISSGIEKHKKILVASKSVISRSTSKVGCNESIDVK